VEVDHEGLLHFWKVCCRLLIYPVKVCPILIWMLDGSVCIKACLVPSVFSLLPISNLMDHVPDLNGHECCFSWAIFRLNTS
jgi:hypothetical protein